ncbi:MAG: hypothetical protein J6X00_02875, partial [Clostridia bacterium]|nr:hypothetical protein [Clostridia bacterium]
KDDEPKSTSDKSTWHKMVESQMLVGNKEYLDALMLDIRNRAIVDNIKIPTLYDPVKEINEAREPAIPYPDKEEKDKFNKVEEYLSKIVVDNASHFKIDASKSLEELERIHDYSIKNPKGPEELIKPIEKNADKLFAPGVKKYYFIEGDKFDTSSAKTFLEKYKISKDLKDTEGKLSEDVPTSDDDNVK